MPAMVELWGSGRNIAAIMKVMTAIATKIMIAMMIVMLMKIREDFFCCGINHQKNKHKYIVK